MLNPRIRKRLKVVSSFTKTSRVVPSRTPFAKAIFVAFLVNLLMITLSVILKGQLPPEIPLFYGAAEGQEQIATSTLLIIPSIISSLFIAVNLFLSSLLGDDFLKKVLVLGAISTSLLAATTTIKIIFLVGSI